MNNIDIFSLASAALLHDIGKLRRTKGKTHGESGAELLDDVGLETESYVARWHHTKKIDKTVADEKDWFTWIVKLSDMIASSQRECYEEKDYEREDKLIMTLSNAFGYNNPRKLQQTRLSCKSWREERPEMDIVENFEKILSKIVEKYGKSEERFVYSLISALKVFTLQTTSAFYYSKPDISLFCHLHSTAAIAVALWIWINENEKIKNDFFAAQNLNELRSMLSLEKLYNEEFALILAADLSGIQDFIFAVTNKGAAKLLKGRSFMVSMLPHIIVTHILKELNLPPTQIIYIGGGNFYLLLPYTDKILRKLNKILKEINYSLLKRFAGQLYLNYSNISLSVDSFKVEKFSKKWDELHKEKLAVAKKRKFKEIIEDDMEKFLYDFLNLFGDGETGEINPYEIIAKPDNACDVCRINAYKHDENGLKLCHDCKQFLELGKGLRNCNYIVLKVNRESSNSKHWEIKIGEYYYSIELFDKLTEKHILNQEIGYPILYILNSPETFWNLSDFDELPENCCPSLLFYGGKYAPVKSRRNHNSIRTFSDLAGLKDEEDECSDPANVLGPKRLGVLRLDVDGLGRIFKDGLKPLSMDRLESLSIFIDLFFSYWLPEELQRWGKENTKKSHNLPEFADLNNKYYILYSGGDDMFIIGSWDIMPYLAEEINKKFKDFVNYNHSVHLSAGLVFFPPKFPIKHQARIAGEAESRAKNFIRYVNSNNAEGLKRKDCIYLFDVCVPWSDFKEMKQMFIELRKNVEKGTVNEVSKVKETLPRGVFHRLLSIVEMYKDHSEKLLLTHDALDVGIPIKLSEFKRDIAVARWTWMLAYSLQKKYENLNDLFEKITKGGGENEELEIPPMEWLKASIIWADWVTRK